jgi:hypothetical protein
MSGDDERWDEVPADHWPKHWEAPAEAALSFHEQLRAFGKAGDWEAALKFLRSKPDWDLENDALRRENEKLREVLKPFADAATALEREYNGVLNFEAGCSIKFSALVAAREALK